MIEHPHGAGKSSFDLIDAKVLLAQLELDSGLVLVDLGCGKGDYSVALAEHIGENGRVYAVDVWPESIAQLKTRTAKQHIRNIKPILADLGQKLPIQDHLVDICLMATVFHDLVRENLHKNALTEIRRILKPAGKLAVIEFKKTEGRPGPPLRIKISPQQLDRMLFSHGFVRITTTDLGPYNYMTVFRCRTGQGLKNHKTV